MTFSSHLAASALSKRFGLQWIVGNTFWYGDGCKRSGNYCKRHFRADDLYDFCAVDGLAFGCSCFRWVVGLWLYVWSRDACRITPFAQA